MASTPSDSVSPLASLPDSQVFSRDAEDYTKEDIADTTQRLKRILDRHRKARDDAAQVAASAIKLKKTNADAKRKKTKLSTNPMETVL